MYLDSGDKTECSGCEACVQACNHNAIHMEEDSEGFRYPAIDDKVCIQCGLCRKVCAFEHVPRKHKQEQYAFGGYHLDAQTRFDSTSGGAFSAIVDAFCDEDYVIFGAEARGLQVCHSYITDKRELGRYRKSKYSQSVIGDAYRQAKRFLGEGKKVLFSGTPCQIAGLVSFLGTAEKSRLLTVEVVCEGVPSPLYIRKLNDSILKKYGASIETIDYRYTGNNLLGRREQCKRDSSQKPYGGRWDFETMRITTTGGVKEWRIDRWFNPFWSIWLKHLMSRPSCYHCRFATRERIADITLGDLWGVHLYCPELYGNNGGASLVICNTDMGKRVFEAARNNMYGHTLMLEDVLKYQGPLRRTISENQDRTAFMADLESGMDFRTINRKWAQRPDIKLLYQKYIWGNRQKVWLWNLKQRIMNRNK